MDITFGNATVGDAMLELELLATSGEIYFAAALAGKTSIIFFYPSEDVPICAGQLIAAYKEAWPQFESRGVTVIGVSPTPHDRQKAFVAEQALPFLLLCDDRLRVSARAGAIRPAREPDNGDSEKLELDAVRRTLLVDPDLRIAGVYDDPEDLPLHIEQLLADIDALPQRESARPIVSHAPVLLVPNVFPAELCRRLIEVWEQQGNEDSGFMKQLEGKTVGIYDYSHKIRRDHFLRPGPELEAVKKYVGRRVFPQITMAFNYEPSRFEDFRIACYDSARGGYFRPHRDNTTDGTAHRRFAMSLLLNEHYEGGAVRFPEFAMHEYRPRAGGCVIFSCSLLHEATDVTAGRRFVLLSFFYGEKEAKIREAYNLRTGGTYRSSTS